MKDTIYWNRNTTEKVVALMFDYYLTKFPYKEQVYKEVEDIVAFLMKKTGPKYEDEYARHNIRNYIYALDRRDNDAYYKGLPLWIGDTVIEIEHDSLDSGNDGKTGTLTSIDKKGLYHGTWGNFAIDPNRCMLEVWNE